MIYRKNILTAFLEFSFWIQYSTGKASFTKTPIPESYAVQGQTVRLEWEYQVDNRNNEFEVNSPRWDYYQNDGTVLPIGSEDSNYGWQWALHKDTCPERLVNRVSKESSANLVIANVTTDDSGVYGCSLVLKMSSALTRKAKLIVTTVPSFTIKPPLKKAVNESGNLSIQCSAHGFPKPNVTWVRIIGNKTVVKSKGWGFVFLQLSNITRSYSGIYKCQANNNPNESPIEAFIQIVVIVSAKFSTIPPKNNFVIEGMYLGLNCSAGNLFQNVTWFHLYNGSKVFKSHGKGGANLRFSKITQDDNGTYECSAFSNIIGATNISALAEVTVMCDCITPSAEPSSNMTQDGNKVQLEDVDTLQGIMNSKTFMIVLLTVTCISVLVNILLIIYICLRMHRNRYRVAENGKEIVRFGPPKVLKSADAEGAHETSPNWSLNNGSAEVIAIKPGNVIYEHIPETFESPSPKETHPYASPLEGKSDQSPEAGRSKEPKQSPKISVLQHHYQDLDGFTMVLNQQEYQSLDSSEAASNPHPKHAPVCTPWKYETLTLNKKKKPSEYQKLHVYANVKEIKTGDDKQSPKSTFK